MSKAIRCLLGGVVLCALPLTVANADTITFDEFPANNNNSPITTLYAALGVTFASDNSGTWGGLSNGDPGNWDLEGTNGPAFLGNNGVNNSNTYVTSIFFSSPMSNVSFDVSRSLGSSLGQTLTASAFAGSTLLGFISFSLGDINQWTMISFGFGGGIDSVILDGSQAGFSPYGVDNLQFTSAIPLPGSLLLLATGLALLRQKLVWRHSA